MAGREINAFDAVLKWEKLGICKRVIDENFPYIKKNTQLGSLRCQRGQYKTLKRYSVKDLTKQRETFAIAVNFSSVNYSRRNGAV